MAWVTIYGPNLRGTRETFHVHASGCADLKRGIYPQYKNEAWDIEVGDLRAIVETVYDSDDFWYGEDPDEYWHALAYEFKFFPCVKLPDEQEPRT